MPSLTISLTFRVELSADELSLVLKSLGVYKDKETGLWDEEARALSTKLREQKAAFTQQMLRQLEPAPEAR